MTPDFRVWCLIESPKTECKRHIGDKLLVAVWRNKPYSWLLDASPCWGALTCESGRVSQLMDYHATRRFVRSHEGQKNKPASKDAKNANESVVAICSNHFRWFPLMCQKRNRDGQPRRLRVGELTQRKRQPLLTLYNIRYVLFHLDFL